jgi:geranylgeranyl pyrophosphate synthase
VLDNASLRRGRPTVYSVAGRGMATATGDLLFSRAFAQLALNDSVDQVRALSLARGELMQREDAWQVVSVERYLVRCELKTARLFEAACELGALVGGADADAIRAFGRRIGLAFQILDDVLDVSGPAERTGKHRGTDLLDGTVTMPFILADLDIDPRSIGSRERAEEVCDAIAATPALERSRATALSYVAQAKRDLPDLPQRAALDLVADGVVERYS